MEYLGTIYKGSQSDIIFPVPFIELSDGATVDFYTDGDGGFSRTKDEIKIDNYMLRTTASADELNSLNDGVLNYTINTCMGKSEGDTGLYLSEPTSFVNKQYLTADGVKTINGESIVGQGNIEIQGGGSEDYIWEWNHTHYYTGNTNFSEEELQSVIDAHNNGKNIIIKNNDLFIYPSIFDAVKTVLLIEYMYNGDTYIFEYDSVGPSQNISKKDESEIYEWTWSRSDMMSLTGGTTHFTIDMINIIKQAISNGKLIVINYVNQYRWPVFTTYIGNHKIVLNFGQEGLVNYQWECQLSSDEQSITYQRVTQTLQQAKLTSRSLITIKNINLANNQDVDSILTNLKKDIFISGFDLSKNSNSTYTVDGNFNTIKRYFTTNQIKGIDTTGEIFNLDFRLKTDGTLAASYISRDMLSNVDNKIYTFILSPNSNDESKMNVQNYITSFDDIYDNIRETSEIVYGFDKRINATEYDLNTLSGSVVNNYYTKVESNLKYALIDNTYTKSQTYSKDESDGKYASKTDTYTKAESDTNYASKTNTYTKEETYSKSEIDTKIGDINNILESI